MIMEKEQYSFQKQENNDNFNIRAELDKYLIHWKWFFLGTITAILLAFLYLRYSTPKYITSSTILIKKEQKGSLSGELAAFEDLGIGRGSNKNIEDEIQIIKSRKLINDVVHKLNLNIKYMVEGRVKQSEVYHDRPITFISNDSTLLKKNTLFTVHVLSNDKFKLLDSKGKTISENLFNQSITNSFLGNFIIVKNHELKDNSIGLNVKIIITSINNVINTYQQRISISPINKRSSILKLSLQSSLKEKARNILDQLIYTYNKNAVNDKKKVSEKTNNFIIERLESIGKDLARIDDDVRIFKSKNNITDIQAEAQLTLQTNDENRLKLTEATTELALAKSLGKELNNSDYLPSNLGLSNSNLDEPISKYNNLISQLKRLEKSAGIKNTVLIEVKENISNLKKSLEQSLENSVRSLQFKVNSLQRESGRFNSKISSIPSKEREFLDIARQQEIIAALYSYLLNKKEETAISLTATATPNAKIIDYAYSSNGPISPKRNIIYLSFLFLGILIPFIIIYLKDLLDTKVHTKKDIEELTSIPFLGDIPHSENKDKIVINSGARSSTAEAFRLIRTNLDFHASAKNGTERGSTIFVTSTTSGEGKSFTSINLAASLSLSGKKVVLVGMDLRAPKITEYLEIFLTERELLTSLLITSITLDSLKFSISTKSLSLDIIASGAIPPNPAELLMTEIS